MKYVKLFTLETLHDYYRDNICRDVIVKPNEGTQNWINKYGCIFKGQLNSWHFFAPETINLNDLTEGNERIKLEFSCKSSHPGFVNFTNFPIDKLGYYYFSNKINEASDNGALILKPEFKSSEFADSDIAKISVELSELLDENEINSPAYKIEFQSRHLAWKYFIIDNSGQYTEPLKLNGEKANFFLVRLKQKYRRGKLNCLTLGKIKFL